jgi:hypothetical protein
MKQIKTFLAAVIMLCLSPVIILLLMVVTIGAIVKLSIERVRRFQHNIKFDPDKIPPGFQDLPETMEFKNGSLKYKNRRRQ